MAWVRIDDVVTEHRKHLKAGPAACWLWVCGIAYCQRQLSDGFIPDEAIGLLGVPRAARLLPALVASRLFDRVRGGYRVHDYLDFNPSRAEALKGKQEKHAAKVKAGKAGAKARWQTDNRTIADVNGTPMAPSHPIPSLTKEPPNPLSAKGGRLRILRKDRSEAERLLRLNFGQCSHEPRHDSVADCLADIAAALAERRRDAEQRATA